MNEKRVNLNDDLAIREDSGSFRELSDNSCETFGGAVSVYFRALEARLIQHIRRARMVVGCVAWLTNEAILRALCEVPDGVSIVVQKEDFLRPDLGRKDGWKDRLRRWYGGPKQIGERFEFQGLLGSLSCCGDASVDPVRCVGNHNRDKSPAFPRMHNKFLVFCHKESEPREGCEYGVVLKPDAVWTGSFNFTANATASLENALVLTDPGIGMAYLREWEQILAVSEPLDWSSDWCEPEWRIGT